MTESRVFAGIPTGASMEHGVLYMLAALRNVDYPSDKFKIVFAITDLNDEASHSFIKRVRNLIANANFPFPVETLTTKIRQADLDRWGVYCYVIKNVRALQRKFLREHYDYFWFLGGDNPPPRNSIHRLLKLNADLASGLLFQRPPKSFENVGAWPLVFRHLWTPKDLENNGFNKEQKRLLKKAWVKVGFSNPLYMEKNWRRLRVVRNVTFGNACCLVKREVMAVIPYDLDVMSPQSEDIQFIQEALARGYTTAVDMRLHCPHLSTDGLAY